MKELSIYIEGIEPVDLLGIHNANLKSIQHAFPDLKITGRGDEIKISGDDKLTDDAAQRIHLLMDICRRQGELPQKIIEQVLTDRYEFNEEYENGNNVILYGRNNLPVRSRTVNQHLLCKAVEENEIVFAIGPAGTGKTYTSVALAVKALKNKEVKRIILTRPAVEAGENLGFLPGDMREKIDPYLRPLYDALDDMLPPDKLKFYLENKTIEIAPLAFMRGRTLDHAFVILDEAQNCSILQLKMFLTRMGPTAKFMVNGDLTQIDLPPSQKSGLVHAIRILQGIKGIAVLKFTVEDVTRHRLVKDILNAYAQKQEDKT